MWHDGLCIQVSVHFRNWADTHFGGLWWRCGGWRWNQDLKFCRIRGGCALTVSAPNWQCARLHCSQSGLGECVIIFQNICFSVSDAQSSVFCRRALDNGSWQSLGFLLLFFFVMEKERFVNREVAAADCESKIENVIVKLVDGGQCFATQGSA